MTSEITDFWLHNHVTANPAVVWDAFKAHTRGQYQSVIGKVRRESSQAFEDVSTRSVEMCRDLKVLYKEILVLWTTTSKNPQRFFKRGNKRVSSWSGLLENILILSIFPISESMLNFNNCMNIYTLPELLMTPTVCSGFWIL